MNSSAPERSNSTELSPSRKLLIQIIRDTHFGRIENLLVRDGEPVLQPPPRIVRTLRFGDGEHVRRIPTVSEIAARPAVQELMRQITLLQYGSFLRIEVRESSPVFSEIEIVAAGIGDTHD